MDPVSITLALGTAATIGTQVSSVKKSFWDPFVWPAMKIGLYLILSAAIVSTVQTNWRLLLRQGQGS